LGWGKLLGAAAAAAAVRGSAAGVLVPVHGS